MPINLGGWENWEDDVYVCEKYESGNVKEKKSQLYIYISYSLWDKTYSSIYAGWQTETNTSRYTIYLYVKTKE